MSSLLLSWRNLWRSSVVLAVMSLVSVLIVPSHHIGASLFSLADLRDKTSASVTALHLSNRDPGRIARFAHTVPVPQADTVRVALVLQGVNLRRHSDIAWMQPQALLFARDARGQANWHRAHEIVALPEGDALRQVESWDYKLRPGDATLRFVIRLPRVTGDLALQTLSVHALQRNAFTDGLRRGVLALWVVWGTALTWSLLWELRPAARLALLPLAVCGAVALSLPRLWRNEWLADVEPWLNRFGFDADALGHGALFAALAMLLRFGLPERSGALLGLTLAWFAGLTEILQLFSDGRGISASDWSVDLLGIALGLFAAIAWQRRRSRASNEANISEGALPVDAAAPSAFARRRGVS